MVEDRLQNDFKKKVKIESVDIQSLFFAFLNRSRFSYGLCDIFEYIFRCLMLRNVPDSRRDPSFKKHFLFEKAEERFKNELDVVRIVRNLRKFKMLA